MLKKFFMNVLSSFMGAWLAIVVLGAVIAVVLISLLGNFFVSQGTPYHLEKGSLMVVDLSGIMEERADAGAPDIMDLVNGEAPQVRSLEKYVKAINEAAVNSNVEAIYLACDGLAASPASLHELYMALKNFKENGKKIYAYANQMSQGDYMLATLADKLYINPQGELALSGIGGYTPYFKDLLDKVGVEMQVVKVGTFKSAVEPYILNEMSEPARAQLDTLYNELWTQYKDIVAKNRKVQPALIDTLINRDYILARTPQLAQESKLIDGMCYLHEMEQKIADALGRDKFEDVNIVDVNLMYNLAMTDQSTKGKQIALVYACGDIDGGGEGGIKSDELVPLIMELADNDDIAAMVLRVNSPGGSAFGSEQIWEALEQFKKADKKLVVSMGDYAASGGYYISCGADKIYADPMTITGSIGIFGMIPNINDLLNDKLGVHMQLVATNPNGAFPSMVKPMTPGQTQAMQQMVEEGYDTFTSRVAKGRNMSQEKVKTIGEGRVWDAVKAKEIGLVDELGTLQDAIDCAANLAHTTDKYYTRTYPELKINIWTLLSEMSDDSNMGVDATTFRDRMLLHQVRRIIQRQPLQARMQDMILHM